MKEIDAPTKRLCVEVCNMQSCQQLAASITSAFSGPVFFLIQWIERLAFGRAATDSLDIGQSLTGRVFDRQTEVRWQKAGDSFSVWILRETNKGSSEGTLYRALPQKVYLLGKYAGRSATNLKFEERHLAADALQHYDWMQGFKWVENDRPYLEIIEYMALPCEIEAGSDPARMICDLENALNVPRVVAHRVCGVGPWKKQS